MYIKNNNFQNSGGYQNYPQNNPQNSFHNGMGFQNITPNPYYYPVNRIPTERELIKKTMSKVSGGILITYAIMSFVVAVLSTVCTLIFGNTSFLLENQLLLLVVSALSSVIALPVGALFISGTNKRSFGSVLPIKRVGIKKSVLLIMAGVGICMLANGVVDVIIYFFSSLGIDITVGTDILSDSPAPTVANIAISLLTTAIIPAICEEILFRGAVLSVLEPFSKGLAVFMSALLFGFLHGNFVQIPFAFIVGLLLAYLTVYTGSIIPAMVVHCINNGFSVVFSFVQNEIDENTFIIIYIAATIVLSLIGILSFILLAKQNKDLFDLHRQDASSYSLKQKVKISLCEPVTIIFISIMTLSSFALVLNL